MTDDMMDKPYEFPLYSLDLIANPAETADDPRYAIPHERSALVIRKELRKRAANASTEICDAAVCTGLAHHALDIPGFGDFGLDAAWAENMRHWQKRMLDQNEARRLLQSNGVLGTRDRHDVDQAARQMWDRLVLCAKLSRLGDRVASGSAPRGRLQLLDALSGAAERVREHAGPLSQHGFGQAYQEQLTQVIAALSDHHQKAGRMERARRDSSNVLLVMRGALIGDLLLLSHAAPHVLPPKAADALLLRRLFPQRRRPEAPAVVQ